MLVNLFFIAEKKFVLCWVRVLVAHVGCLFWWFIDFSSHRNFRVTCFPLGLSPFFILLKVNTLLMMWKGGGRGWSRKKGQDKRGQRGWRGTWRGSCNFWRTVKTETGAQFLLHNISSDENTFEGGWNSFCNMSSWRTCRVSKDHHYAKRGTSWGFTQSSTWRSWLSISPLVLSKIHQTLWPCSTKMFLRPFLRTLLCRVWSVFLRWGTSCWPVKLKKIWTWCSPRSLYMNSEDLI